MRRSVPLGLAGKVVAWSTAQRVVVVEFPTMQQLRRWYSSEDHAEALAVRKTALTRRLLFVDGVDETEAT